MTTNYRLLFGLFFVWILAILIYFLFPDFTYGLNPTEITYLLLSALPMLGVGYALRQYGFKGRQGKAFLSIFLAFVCFFVGELLWTYFEFRGLDPFPSVADYFFILFYPLFLCGLVKEMKLMQVKWSSFKLSAHVMMLIFLTLLAALVGYFGIYYAYDPEVPLWENVVSIAYGVGDFILIVLTAFVLKMIQDFEGGLMRFSWLAIFFGLFFTLLADVGFAIYYESYDSGIFGFNFVLDHLWIVSFLAFAYGFMSLGNHIKEVQQRALNSKKML